MLCASTRQGRRPAAVVAAIAAAALLLSGCGTDVVPGRLLPTAEAVGAVIDQRPCPHSAFECITLAVPADHFAPTSPLWEATFALHRGRKDSRGVLVTATGGPGSSGISAADGYMSSLPPEITDHYDLVFFDQRGIGLTRPFRCDEALAVLDADPIDSSADAAARDAYAARTTAAIGDCFAEAGVSPSDAPRYATRQSAEDLEVFRSWLGADSLILYGESYGTQYQQTYAAAHPEHVAGLILDGAVDLQTGVLPFLAESAHAYSDVLATTLAACDADPVCPADAPGTSVAGYDALAAELAAHPRGFAYPSPDGSRTKRRLTLDDLRTAAAGSVSTQYNRTQFQRALNAALQGDEVPMARLAAAGAGADPQTGEVVPDPTFSEALYYAVECEDYDFVPPGSTGRAQVDTWLGTARQSGIDQLWIGDVFYGDLPCLFWPGAARETTARPDIGAAPPYPVLLLTADTDPNTPIHNAERLLARTTSDSLLVRQTGGPHVIFGRGDPCVDDLVTGVITSLRLPSGRTKVCPGDVAEVYEPNPPPRADGYTTPEQTVQVVLAELLDEPGFDTWSGEGTMTLGCARGGTASYSADWAGAVTVDLAGCTWTPGVAIDGTVTAEDWGSGDVELDIELPFAALTMSSSGDLGGTFRGDAVH